MPVVFSCGCGQTLRVADSLAGKQARCPKCQAVVTAPTASVPPPPPPPAPKPVAAPPPAAAPKPPALARAAPALAAPLPAANPFEFGEDEPRRPAKPRRPSQDEDEDDRPRRKADDDKPNRPRRPEPEGDEGDEPRSKVRKRAGKKADPDAAKRTKLILLVAGGVAVLMGCLTVGGVGAYFLFNGGGLIGPPAEERLVGTWVSDSEENKKTGNMAADFVGYTITFNADGTYTMTAILELKGKWTVTSWDGTTAKVKTTANLFGRDTDPVTSTFKFRDADHVDYDAGKMPDGKQGMKCVLRRATPAEVLANANMMKPGEKAGGNNPFGGAFPQGFPQPAFPPGFPQPNFPKDFPQPSVPPVLGPSAESRLSGEWEYDFPPDRSKPTQLAPTGMTVTFRDDHTFLMKSGRHEATGKWEVESWDGKTARLKMDDTITAGKTRHITVTYLDADHWDYKSEDSGQTGQLRRPSAPPPTGAGKGFGRPDNPGGNPPQATAPAPPGTDPQAQKPPENPQPPEDPPGRRKPEWTTQTVKPGTVTVTLPGKLSPGSKAPGRSFGAAGIRPENTVHGVGIGGPSVGDVQFIRVYYFENPRLPAGQLKGRPIAEALGSICMYEYAKEDLAPTKKFAADGGRQGAIFFHTKSSYLLFAVGDKRGVLVITCKGQKLPGQDIFKEMKEDDPTAKRIFDSVKFPD